MKRKRVRQFSRRRKRPDINIRLKENLTLKGRYWIEKNGQMFLASGRIELLENIERLHSITKAASAMNISYRNAWMLVDHMNRISNRQLVKTRTGGKGGGGSFLTAEGKKCIEMFYSVCECANRRLGKF